MCPKSYHPLCVGKEAMPRGKWHCPWHYCVECGVLVNSHGAWCRHCPNAYCKNHKDNVITHDTLGALCNDHEEEIEFLIQCVSSKTHGLDEFLPCPSPNPEQLAIWRKARGVEPISVGNTDQSESETSNADIKEFKESKPKRSRFSVEPESRDGSVGLMNSHNVQQEIIPTSENRAGTPIDEEYDKVTDSQVTKFEVNYEQNDTIELASSDEGYLDEPERSNHESQEEESAMQTDIYKDTEDKKIILESPVKSPDIQTVDQKKLKLASLEEKLTLLKTNTPTFKINDQEQLVSPRRSQRKDCSSQELTLIGNQSVVCSVENCREKRQFDIVNYGKHFSLCHKDLDLDKLLVTNEKGVKYAVLDIYKFVYRCGYNKCSQLFFGINENSKADFIKKIKGHWSNSSKGEKSHKEETNKECVFENA